MNKNAGNGNDDKDKGVEKNGSTASDLIVDLKRGQKPLVYVLFYMICIYLAQFL